MAEPDNLVLEHLYAIHDQIAGIGAEMRAQREHMNGIERTLERLDRGVAETRAEVISLRADLGGRLDRVTDRVERIERRLDLAEA